MTNQGFSIVEIMVVIFVLAVALMSILGLLTFSLSIANLLRDTTEATNVAQETMEAVRNFRDGTSWNTEGLGTLTNGIAYHPEKTSDTPPKWGLVTGEDTIDNFTRKVVVEAVFRDGNDDIVETGGTLDPDTKKATVTVSWGTREVELVTYFTNWQE